MASEDRPASITLPNGHVLDLDAAARHDELTSTAESEVIGQPDVDPTEAGEVFGDSPGDQVPSGVLDPQRFDDAISKRLDGRVSGYQWGARIRADVAAEDQYLWAKSRADGYEGWTYETPMHVASVSKFIAAIAMTRALIEAGIDSSASIADHFPEYWSVAEGVKAITFGDLMTHRSGFVRQDLTPYSTRRFGDTSVKGLKQWIEQGPTMATGADVTYSNVNFSLLRVLVPIVAKTVPADFDPQQYGVKDRDWAWDYLTVARFEDYCNTCVFGPAGITPPSTGWFARADNNALAYTAPENPEQRGWNSGYLAFMAGGAGSHISAKDLISLMGCLRRDGTIISTQAADRMMNKSFGFDNVVWPRWPGVPWKSGLWQNSNDPVTGRREQCVIAFAPNNTELVLFANSSFYGLRQGTWLVDILRDAYNEGIQP